MEYTLLNIKERKVVVVGTGNVLFRDDGLGIHVARMLKKTPGINTGI
jgi:Ni,Fe-hydrogenase maturation factor